MAAFILIIKQVGWYSTYGTYLIRLLPLYGYTFWRLVGITGQQPVWSPTTIVSFSWSYVYYQSRSISVCYVSLSSLPYHSRTYSRYRPHQLLQYVLCISENDLPWRLPSSDSDKPLCSMVISIQCFTSLRCLLCFLAFLRIGFITVRHLFFIAHIPQTSISVQWVRRGSSFLV